MHNGSAGEDNTAGIYNRSAGIDRGTASVNHWGAGINDRSGINDRGAG